MSRERARRPRRPGGRLRRGGLRRRRAHGPARHDDVLRQAPLEQRRRHVQRGRRSRRHHSTSAGTPGRPWRTSTATAGPTSSSPATRISTPPVATSSAGFPSNFQGVRDLLYLNEGPGAHGHATFREVGVQAGLEAARFAHGLGAVFTDFDGDGRPDLYVANDDDPNQLYENVGWPGGARADPAGLGFRFEERAHAEGVADPYAGMGIAARRLRRRRTTDLVRDELAAGAACGVPRRREPARRSRRAPEFAPRSRRARTGWGATWADLALDGRPELVIANGAIPVTNLAHDAGRLQIARERLALGCAAALRERRRPGRVLPGPRVNGRGLAAADYDNNGTVDIAVGSIGGRLVLLRNTGERGHWLEVSLPSFAPGAVVTAELSDGRRLVQELHAGSSYLSSEDPRVHLGLGKAASVRRLIVRFPDGTTTRLADVAADRVVVVKEPPAPATRDEPRRARTWPPAAARASPRSARSLVSGTRPRSACSGRPRRPSRRATSSTSPPRCGTPGRRTTRRRTATSRRRSVDASDVAAARSAAISFAAYRLLLWRASYGRNVRASFARLTATLRSLCYRPGFTDTHGDSPRCARQPDRGGRDRVRTDGRLARGAALPRPELHGRERASRRRPAGRDDARPHLLAAARARPGRRPGRAARSGEGAVLRRVAVGTGARVSRSRRTCRPSTPGRPRPAIPPPPPTSGLPSRRSAHGPRSAKAMLRTTPAGWNELANADSDVAGLRTEPRGSRRRSSPGT